MRFRLSPWPRRAGGSLLTDDSLEQVERGSFAPLEPLRPLTGDGEAIRIATWNIASGRRYRSILRTLTADLVADVYLLQEVDVGCRRSGWRNVARQLAEELSVHYAYGAEFRELAQEGRRQPAFHGQAVLSRFPIRAARLLRFQHQPMDWSGDFFQPRRGGRLALVCEIDLGETTLLTYNTHLESRGAEPGRVAQMDEILIDIREHGGGWPAVIAGDLNTKQADAQGRFPVIELARRHGFADATVRGAGNPPSCRRLDWILTRGLRSAPGPTHGHTRASDHRPVSVELQVQSKAALSRFPGARR